MQRNVKQCTLYVELKPECVMRQLLQEARDAKISLSNLQLEKNEMGAVSLITTVKSREKSLKKRTSLLEAVQRLPSVAYFEEL